MWKKTFTSSQCLPLIHCWELQHTRLRPDILKMAPDLEHHQHVSEIRKHLAFGECFWLKVTCVCSKPFDALIFKTCSCIVFHLDCLLFSAVPFSWGDFSTMAPDLEDVICIFCIYFWSKKFCAHFCVVTFLGASSQNNATHSRPKPIQRDPWMALG